MVRQDFLTVFVKNRKKCIFEPNPKNRDFLGKMDFFGILLKTLENRKISLKLAFSLRNPVFSRISPKLAFSPETAKMSKSRQNRVFFRIIWRGGGGLFWPPEKCPKFHPKTVKKGPFAIELFEEMAFFPKPLQTVGNPLLWENDVFKVKIRGKCLQKWNFPLKI